jgi:hypothetical protein
MHPDADITPAMAARLLARVAKRAPTASNDLLRFMRRVFRFAVRRRLIATSPVADFNLSDAGGEESARQRSLSREELEKLFKALRDAPSFGGTKSLGCQTIIGPRRAQRRIGIDPDRVFAGKVAKNDVVGHGNQQPVAAVAALDARLLAYTGAPLVATSRGVTGLARRLAFPADWIDVYAAAKQPPEQYNLFTRGKMGGFGLASGRLGYCRLSPIDPVGIQQRGEAFVFRLKRCEWIPFGHGDSISAASPFTYLP